MRVTIDSDAATLTVEDSEPLDLYSPGAFQVLSRLWLKTGWALKHSYSFTWLGRPVIQLPEDLVRLQELVHQVRPDVLVETGIAHGGSLIFYASLFKLLGRGRVIGVDVEIRPHNRAALEAHPLRPCLTLIEGSSVDPAVVARVAALLAPGERVMVVLDSNHSREHVLRELRAYAPLVSPGSYVAVADGIMQDLADVPGGQAAWREDNPLAAVREFLAEHPEFAQHEPAFAFNEGRVAERIGYWPHGLLLRRG